MLNLTVCGFRKADTYLSTGRYTAMVSISDPCGTKRGERRTGKDLLLNFHDSWPGVPRYASGLATEHDVSDLILFAERLTPDDVILTHCGRGRSRSTASAIIMLATAWTQLMWAEDYAPRDIENWAGSRAAKQVFAIAPKSTPNGYILDIGERLLSERWKLDIELRKYCYGRVKGPKE